MMRRTLLLLVAVMVASIMAFCGVAFADAADPGGTSGADPSGTNGADPSGNDVLEPQGSARCETVIACLLGGLANDA